MLSQLVTYGKFGNLFCAIEHTSIKNKEQLNGLLLKKRKNAFETDKSITTESIVKLKENLKNQQHLFLIINTEKVLSKMLNGIYGSPKALSNAFPNLDIKDFYFEVFTSSENTFISICRRDYINELLQEYENNRLNVIGFSLGNLVSSHLAGIAQESSIKSPNGIISFSNQNINDIVYSNNIDSTSYSINGLEINNRFVLSLAGIISYYTNQNKTLSNFSDTVHHLAINFKQKRIFDIGIKTSLSVVFVLLLTSFMLFSNYSTKINTLTAELELNKSYKTSLLKLSEQVNKKERIVTNFSMTSSKASWFLDQLGSSLPNSILLSEIQFQPILKKIKEDAEILIKENEILIQGTSNNSGDYSNWISTLEQQEWIENVTIQEYGIGKKSITEFEILIQFIK